MAFLGLATDNLLNENETPGIIIGEWLTVADWWMDVYNFRKSY